MNDKFNILLIFSLQKIPSKESRVYYKEIYYWCVCVYQNILSLCLTHIISRSITLPLGSLHEQVRIPWNKEFKEFPVKIILKGCFKP